MRLAFTFSLFTIETKKKKRCHDSINFNETFDSSCVIVVKFLFLWFYHCSLVIPFHIWTDAKSVSCAAYFSHFSCVLKKNCIAFSLLPLILLSLYKHLAMHQIYKLENWTVLANPGTCYFRPTEMVRFQNLTLPVSIPD